VDVLRLEAALLRSLLPELRLQPGMVLPARVLERAGGHGLLLLAGAPVSAELPREIEAGARLRLRVAGIESERVVLQVVRDVPAPAAASAAPAAVPLTLPDGRTAAVRVEEQAGGRGGGGGETAVQLRYESRALSPLGLRLTAGPGGVRATVTATAGAPEAAARGAAAALQEALARATGRPGSVRVIGVPGEPTLDIRA
jgi:hypothetical protein